MTYRQECGVAVYAISWLALLLVVRPTGLLFSIVNATYFGIGAVTLLEQWRMSRSPRWDAGTRAGWRWLGFSAAWMWLGGAAWTAALASFGKDSHPLLSNLVDLGYIPFAIIGFMRMPVNPRVSLRDRSVRMDAGLLALGIVALSWHFALRPRLTVPGGDHSPIGILTAIGEWLVAITASVAYVRAADPGTRRAIAFALVAHLVFIFSDYWWVQAQGSYLPGHAIDALWFSAWLLRYTSVRVARHATPIAPNPDRAYQGGLAPTAFVAGAYSLLLLSVRVEGDHVSLDIALAALAMTALLLVRQVMALNDNRRLARETATQAAHFRSLVSHATDFVMVLDDARRVTWASPSAERTLGVLVGDPFARRLDPEDAERILAWLSARPAAGGAAAQRCRIQGRTGAWMNVELRVQDRRDDPLIGGVVVNSRDISEELALEGRLGHVRKLGTLSDMAGRIAHAFNNTLAVLQGHAELLARELAENSDAKESLVEIQAAAERGAGITRQLLGFSGRHVIRPEVVEPRTVLADLAPSFRKLLPESAHLTIDVGPPGVAVEVDRAQFEQVLVNLVANARDALIKGGSVAIGVTTEEATSDDAPGNVLVSVRDTGTGIPEGIRDRIFEPFFTTKAPGRGTGLGLAMVNSIVRRAGGRVEVMSAPGQGTTFTIALPRVSMPEQLPAIPAHESPEAPVDGVILLVDDEPGVRRVARRILQREGYQVYQAGSGDEAIAVLQTQVHIDLLITDLMMPGMSSRALIAWFQEHRPGVPVICISGFAAEQDPASPLAQAVHAIVAKPFVAATLLRAVAGAMQVGVWTGAATGDSAHTLSRTRVVSP